MSIEWVQKTMTLQELQKEYLSRPSESRLAPEDFFVLLAETTGQDKTFLLAHPEYVIDAETEARARSFFARRLTHEPVAYIVGHKEFYGRDFLVTPDTLIPRPETELLVERVVDRIRNQESLPVRQAGRIKNLTIIDIGTGSGNIIISIASESNSDNPKFKIPDSRFDFFATDISAGALTIARENAQRHNVGTLISFHEGSLIEPILDDLAAADEIIIAANLPYLSETIYQASDADVRDFEPRSALISDAAGLDHYHRLLDQTKVIGKSTTLFLEISPEQTPLLKGHLREHFPEAHILIHQDLSGRDRIVEIHLI